MSARPIAYLDLRGPIIVLILAATAVPVEFKPPGSTIGFFFQPIDFLENIAGYIPIGLALSGLPAARAILLAAVISILAECSQSVMLLRDSSTSDVVANVLGACIGLAVAVRWRLQTVIPWRRWMALIAAVLAIVIVTVTVARAPPASSQRGAAMPGVLEAYWAFEEAAGSTVRDTSPHHIDGNLRHEVVRVQGAHGGAISLDGVDDYIDFGRPAELNMIGSLTVSAWIKASSNPVDDAVVVSNLNGLDNARTGFQLDTTVDTGPRTIGFKLGDACGGSFARYGATALALDTWYFLAGVYDAHARTVHVYLNGQLDDGQLSGVVPDKRRIPRDKLSIGRRSNRTDFQFAGLIDEVRIHSRALGRDEVVADMMGTEAFAGPETVAENHGDDPLRAFPDSNARCPWSSDSWEAGLKEARLPAVAAILGMLLLAATMGLARPLGPVLGIALGCCGGLLLFRSAVTTLPSFNAWTFAVTGAVAAASVAVCARVKVSSR